MASSRGRWVRGDREFVRLLRRLPESIREEIAEMLSEAGDEMLSAMRSATPVRSGRLRRGLSKKVSKRALRLRVGLVGRPANEKLPHRFVVEFGRKPKTVQAQRRAVSGEVSSYQMRLRKVAGRPFVNSPRALNIRRSMGGRLSGFWEKVLAKAAQGAGDE